MRNKLIPHAFLWLRGEKVKEEFSLLDQLYKQNSLMSRITKVKKAKEPRVLHVISCLFYSCVYWISVDGKELALDLQAN